MKTMKFRLFMFLLGVSLPDWTKAKEEEDHGSRQESIVESGTLIHVEMTNYTHINLSYRSIHKLEYEAFLSIEESNVKSLDLSHNNLDDSLFYAIQSLRNLEILLLSHNKIAYFPTYTGDFEKLKYLDISSNPITKSLYLEGMSLQSLPVSAIIYVGADKIFPSEPVNVQFDYEKSHPNDWRLYNSRSIVEENRQIKLCKTVDGLVKSIEESKGNETLGDCMRLNVIFISYRVKRLDLSNLGIRKFERNWYKLENNDITTLKLYNNTITDITPELLNDLPSELTSIDLGYNNITIIKNNTMNNRNIKGILLDNNAISIIEDNAFENMNLKGLILQKNRLDNLLFVETLPANITLLELSCNSFPVISANTFQGLKKMKKLYLSDSHIETIEPGAFENLENLETIHMDFNQISELKSGLFRDVKKLKNVDLSFNRIKKIPRDIFSIENMDMNYLDLGHNQIDTIEVGSFSNWTIYSINLEMNKITEEFVTKAIFEECSVEELNLGDNLISEINESFLDIPVLNSLNLTRNHIRSVKKDFMKNMRILTELDLSENPLNHLENGAFYQLESEMYPEDIGINLSQVPIKYFEAGIFRGD